MLVADVHPEVLAITRRNLANTNGASSCVPPCRALPLADDAVDVVHASLLLHHLDPRDAVIALREMRRVAREAVVVNDLRRGRCRSLWRRPPCWRSPGADTPATMASSARRAYTLAGAGRPGGGGRPASRGPQLGGWPRVTTVYR